MSPSVRPAQAAFDRMSAEIRATAALPGAEQVDRLVAGLAASGGDAPGFAALLIGELVLTRMRLAARDPLALAALGAFSP